MAGLSRAPSRATRGPTGGITMTSPGKRRTSALVSPLWINLYRSSVDSVFPPRTRRICRMLPVAAGPPLSNRALIRVDMLETVNTPGLRACPTTKTWMERSLPSVALSSKFLKTRAMWFFKRASSWSDRMPATVNGPARGTVICPWRSTVRLSARSIVPQIRRLISSPGPIM